MIIGVDCGARGTAARERDPAGPSGVHRTRINQSAQHAETTPAPTRPPDPIQRELFVTSGTRT